MKLVKIYLKGGQTIAVNCMDVDVFSDSLGNVYRIDWYSPDVQTKYLRTADISAIVEA